MYREGAMPATLERFHEPSLSPLEKQEKLNDLTDRYFAGEIGVDEFLDQRDVLAVDVERFAHELAMRRKERDRTQHAPSSLPHSPLPADEMTLHALFGLVLIALGLRKRQRGTFPEFPQPHQR
jgi:hypothetical protein